MLKGKKILVTGVLTKQSIAFFIAKEIVKEGGEIILTGVPPKGIKLTEKAASFLNSPPVIPLDVTSEEDVKNLPKHIKDHWGGLDGFLHSIGYAPPSCLSSNFADAPWEDVKTAIQISSYSLARLGSVLAPMMKGGSIVSLDFDATLVWPGYNWMGVAKATLESITKYLAMDLGERYKIRVNAIASGPVRTMASKGIKNFDIFETLWKNRAILGWDPKKDAEEVAKVATFLFSDYSRKITGEIIHVDGGFHIMGSPTKRENLLC